MDYFFISAFFSYYILKMNRDNDGSISVTKFIFALTGLVGAILILWYFTKDNEFWDFLKSKEKPQNPDTPTPKPPNNDVEAPEDEEEEKTNLTWLWVLLAILLLFGFLLLIYLVYRRRKRTIIDESYIDDAVENAEKGNYVPLVDISDNLITGVAVTSSEVPQVLEDALKNLTKKPQNEPQTNTDDSLSIIDGQFNQNQSDTIDDQTETIEEQTETIEDQTTFPKNVDSSNIDFAKQLTNEEINDIREAAKEVEKRINENKQPTTTNKGKKKKKTTSDRFKKTLEYVTQSVNKEELPDVTTEDFLNNVEEFKNIDRLPSTNVEFLGLKNPTKIAALILKLYEKEQDPVKKKRIEKEYKKMDVFGTEMVTRLKRISMASEILNKAPNLLNKIRNLNVFRKKLEAFENNQRKTRLLEVPKGLDKQGESLPDELATDVLGLYNEILRSEPETLLEDYKMNVTDPKDLQNETEIFEFLQPFTETPQFKDKFNQLRYKEETVYGGGESQENPNRQILTDRVTGDEVFNKKLKDKYMVTGDEVLNIQLKEKYMSK